MPRVLTRSSICFKANGEGLTRSFSQRQMVGKVTPSFAASFSWVSPILFRNSRTKREIFFLGGKVGPLENNLSDDKSGE